MSHLQDRRGCSKWGTDNPIEVAMCMKINHRSEEHTSELQSLRHLVCRLLLEKKKQSGERRTRMRGAPRTQRPVHEAEEREIKTRRSIRRAARAETPSAVAVVWRGEESAGA